MDLSALKFVIAVAEQGSVTGAARSLHCVQSNVTARIKQLETELGVPLFHRVRRRLVMTPAGKTLLGYAQRIQRLTLEAQRAVQEGDRPRGPLLVGAMETTAGLRLADRLALFHQRYPEVQLNLETGTTRDLTARVLAAELDAALVAGPVVHAELTAEVAFEEELVLITARDLTPEAALRRAPLNLLMFKRGCSYRDRLEQWVRTRHAGDYRCLEFGTLEAILSCAAAGMGIAAVPVALVERHRERDWLGVHALPAGVARVPTVLIRRRDGYLSKALQAFIEQLHRPAVRPGH